MNRRGMFLAALAAPFGFLFGRSTAMAEPIKLQSAVTQLKPLRTPKLRVWKMGSLEHRILPTQVAIQRLRDILNQWDGESDLELIWDQALSMEQIDVNSGDVDIVVPVDAEIDVIQRGDGPNIRIVRKESTV